MKKNILYMILFCCLGLLSVSCGDDEDVSGVKGNQVRISALLPEDIFTKQSGDIDGHTLRYILEVRVKGEATKVLRKEITVEPAAEVKNGLFDITLDAGTYDCVIWADYIDAATAAADDKHFTDKYYDTSNLENVRVKDANWLINNDASDAFYYSGELNKGGENLVMELSLVRPFTKVSVLEKNLREFKKLLGLKASFKAPLVFNAVTGIATTEETVLSVDIPTFNPDDTPDGTLFSAYVFSNMESHNMDAIQLTFITKEGTKDVAVPAGLVPLLRGQHVKVSGNMMAETPPDNTDFDITFDIDVEEWSSATVDVELKPIQVKVGDFFFKDGTYGNKLTDENKGDCIGIVYAVGSQPGDDITNYPNSDGKNIEGYVVSLKPLEPTEEFIQSEHKLSGRLYLYNQKNKIALPAPETKNDIVNHNGYAMTQKLLSFDLFKAHIDDETYPALQCFYAWLNGNEVVKPTSNTSEWYIPSARQVLDIIGGSYGFAARSDVKLEAMEKTELAVSLAKAIELGIGSSIGGNGYNMFNSSLNQNSVPEPVTIQVNKEADKTTKGGLNTVKYSRENVAGYVRPVLTIIK